MAKKPKMVKIMVTRTNILYSIAAVRRILGLADRVMVQIREFGWVIWVWVKGRRPTFISKKLFKQHFVDRRKAEAKGLTVTQNVFNKNEFTVRNEAKKSAYQVTAGNGVISCECEDFNNQINFFGRAACKHVYAVLGILGHSSLKDFVNL